MSFLDNSSAVPAQSLSVSTDAISSSLSMPAISDVLHNTGDVFILTSLLTHCVITKDVYLQAMIRMPAWIFAAIVCSSNVRFRDDRYAVLQEILRLGIIIYYGVKLNFSYQLQKLLRSAKQRGLLGKRARSEDSVVTAANAITSATATTGIVRPHRRDRLLSEDEVDRFFKGVPTLLKRNNEPVAYHTVPFDKTLEISQTQFSTHQNLQRRSRCHHGLSFDGTLQNGNSGGKIRACVKTNLAGDLTALRGLMKEVKLLKLVGHHDNLQTILGVCTKDIKNCGKIFLVLENCGDRSLQMYLEELRTAKNSQLIPDVPLQENLLIDFCRWAYEISSGMKFISSKSIVHGMLTCDCILVNEVGTIKLTDYGTAPHLSDSEPLTPESWDNDDWKYLAPEAIIKHQFTTSADIWSFGIVLWKIFTINDDPFPAFSRYSKIFPVTLLDGTRPVHNDRIPKYIFDLLTKCWLLETDKRPNFDMCCQYTYMKTMPKRRIVTCDDDDFIT